MRDEGKSLDQLFKERFFVDESQKVREKIIANILAGTRGVMCKFDGR